MRSSAGGAAQGGSSRWGGRMTARGAHPCRLSTLLDNPYLAQHPSSPLLSTKSSTDKMTRAISCNIRTCALQHAPEAIVHIRYPATSSGCSSHIGCIVLQECGAWAGCDIQLGSSSWQIYGKKDNHTAIAVRDSARPTVQDWGTSDRITFVKTSATLCISSCLPDSGYDVDDYVSVVDNIVRTIKIHRGRTLSLAGGGRMRSECDAFGRT